MNNLAERNIDKSDNTYFIRLKLKFNKNKGNN